MTVVTFDHVTKRFQQSIDGQQRMVAAVDNVSIKLADGEVLAIVGPSGCGKSTLLRLMAGLETPDEGTVYYDNVPLNEIDMRDRGIGMVFQNGALMPHWEGWKTVGFFLSLRQRQQEVPARVHRVSQVTGVGLEQLLERRPNKLSGGEQQRVGIARALARDPRVFLFDEPFANLDAKIRAQARTELKRLLYEFPVTSVYVTHDQIEAIALADRIAVMREGQIEQVGTYQELYQKPINLFVGGFVGTPLLNTFPGEVVEGVWQGDVFGGFPIRRDMEGKRVIMGVRPEHVQLSSDGAAATVERVTPFFAERYNLVDVYADRSEWQLTVPLDTHLEVGETIHCMLDPEMIHFFDFKTGQRVG